MPARSLQGVSPRAFVERSTRVVPVPGLEGIRLHLADDAMALWHATREATGDADEPIPFWGMAWGGGLAIVRVCPGASGCRRWSAGPRPRIGVRAVRHRGGSRRGTFGRRGRYRPFRGGGDRAECARQPPAHPGPREDVLDQGLPDVDIVLAGDCWYESTQASRVMAWSRRAWESGVDVLLGDPGRRYLPLDGLRELAALRRSLDGRPGGPRADARLGPHVRPVIGHAASTSVVCRGAMAM